MNPGAGALVGAKERANELQVSVRGPLGMVLQGLRTPPHPHPLKFSEVIEKMSKARSC